MNDALLAANGSGALQLRTGERVTHLLGLWNPPWRFWTDPVSTVVAPWFLSDECFPINSELAELGFTEPGKKFRAPRDLCAGNALDDATNTMTTDAEVGDFEGENPVLRIADVVHLHGG